MTLIKNKSTIFVSLVIGLCLVLGLYFILSEYNNNSVVSQPRTIELSISPELDDYMNLFDEKELTYDSTNVNFTGNTSYDAEILEVYDKVSLQDEINPDLVKTIFNFSFNLDTMQFHTIIELVDDSGNTLEVDDQVTDAFVTETGGLDAIININGQEYLLSDYAQKDAIENCFWGLFCFIVAIVIVVIVIVAETAEQIKCRENYTYNKNLEASGNGLALGDYIKNQQASPQKNYRFGFTDFGHVGCEVAAAYNMMINLNRAERLSETIYSFESLCIEFAVGFGKLGSNPHDIYRYFIKKGIGYNSYYTTNSMQNAVDNKGDCIMILSYWNSSSLSGGLHTIFVVKEENKFYPYNYYSVKAYYENIQSLCKSTFIKGYVVN